MIIRTPTRTKTKSFNGKQMDFTFPPEDFPREAVDEHSLDNHRILNETLKLKQQEDIEASSQIFSDYTSASNANTYSGNSSNYYSFANISDNTTTSPKLFSQGNSMMPPPILEHKVSSYRETSPGESLDPQNSRIQSNYSFSNSLRDVTNPAKSVTMESTAPTHQTIPTADNISVSFSDITGYDEPLLGFDATQPELNSNEGSQTPKVESNQTKEHKKLQSVVKTDITKSIMPAPKPLNLDNTPSIQKVYSNSMLASSMNSSTQPAKTPRSSRSTASSRSSLKRSNAVRCRGGLLQYFTQMGIRVRRQFKKLRLVVRRKLFRFKKNSKNLSRSNSIRSGLSISRVPKLRNNNNGKQRQESSSFAPHTLHQKRTQGYASKLQKSMSMRSLEPALVTPTIPEKIETAPKPVEAKTVEPRPQTSLSQKIKNTPSLRRTPSSIRRAASILTSNVATPRSTVTNNKNSPIETENYQSSRYSSRNSSLKSKTRLVRSSGSNALSSIARQPSIVVKNKVIPLSMSRFSIKEEIEEEDEAESDDSLDYYLETEPVDEMTPISTPDSDRDQKSTHMYGTNTGDIKTLYKHYLSTIIAERIRARIDMAKEQSEMKISQNSSAQSSKDPIVSILTEYESGAESNLFEEEQEPVTPVTTDRDDEIKEQEEEDDLVTALPGLPPLRDNHGSTISISIHSPFISDNASSNSTIFCIPVKRSLTLPVMKV